MYNTVIFDFDGTIADTKEGIMKGAHYALTGLGIAVENFNELHVFVGPTLWYSFETFYKLDAVRQNKAVELYREYYSVTGIYEAQPYPGMKKLLEELHHKNYKIGIASAKVQHSVEHALEFMGISQYFHAVAGSHPGGAHSDKAELIADVMNMLGVTQADRAVVVGDSKTDAAGAERCGLDFIAALYDREISEFEGQKIDHKAYSVEELSEILISRAGK